MHRGLGAAQMLIVPALGTAGLLRLGHLSWLSCFSPGRADTFVLSEELFIFAFCTLPWLPFALIHLLARNDRARLWNLITSLAMVAIMLNGLLPVDSQHHCDRNGASAGFLILGAIPFAAFLAVLTQLIRLALNAGKPAHDI